MISEGRSPEKTLNDADATDQVTSAGPYFFARLIELFNSAGTLLILALLVLINTDIGGRAFFNSPVSGVPEMVRLSIVAIVFLQAAHTLKVGRLTRANFIIDRVASKWLRVSGVLKALYNFTGAALFLIILIAVYPSFTIAWRDDLFIGATLCFNQQ